LQLTKTELEELMDKYKLKRALYADCRKVEGEKEREIYKAEVQFNQIKVRVG
jgi:hypothetical protein